MKAISCFALLLLIGCASRPPADEVARADFGAYPTNYRTMIEEEVRLHLIDPYSAHIDIATPQQVAVKRGFKWDYCWGVHVVVNAKNRFGGYVGRKLYYFLLPDEHTIQGPFTDTGVMDNVTWLDEERAKATMREHGVSDPDDFWGGVRQGMQGGP